MLSDTSSDAAHVFAVFLLTYGFVGLEMVAIELDNPFGDDPNDFNNAYVYIYFDMRSNDCVFARSICLRVCLFFLTGTCLGLYLDMCMGGWADNSAMAMVAYEDIYLTILSIDGPEWTDKLRMRMYDPNNKEPLPTEQTWLLEKIV